MKAKACCLFSLLLWPSFLLLSQPLHSQTNITASSSAGFMKALGTAGDDFASSIQRTVASSSPDIPPASELADRMYSWSSWTDRA